MLALAVSAGAVPLERIGPYFVVPGVFINSQGPFRFLLDTGAQSSAISPATAERIRIRPDSRVEQVTAAGSLLVPAARSVTISAAGLEIPGLEVMIGAMGRLPGLDGILGQNFLGTVNYLLDVRGARLVLGTAGMDGPAVPFERRHGRMVIEAHIDGQPHRLALDSGAPAVVLFGAVGTPNAILATNAGATPASVSDRTLAVGSAVLKRVAVAEIAAPPAGPPGLLPVTAFDSLYVNNEEGYVRLNPVPRFDRRP